MESVEARKGKQSKCEIEQKKGDGLFWYSTHLYANKTPCKRRVLITLGVMSACDDRGGETVCPCAALHAFILACKRVADKKKERGPLWRQTAVSACSKLRAHRLMYTCTTPYQREGDTSQSRFDRAAEIIAGFDSLQ